MNEVVKTGLEEAVKIIRDIDFPTLPLYIQQIQREMKKKDPSFRKISNFISQDIALTARILKTVNSAAFVSRYRIENVLQALTTIGLDEFYLTVLTEAIKKQLNNHYLSDDNFNYFWKHSTAVANGCQFIAQRLNEYSELSLHFDENHAYLTGLFHDCGIPVMAARFDNYENELLQSYKTKESLIDMEQRLFMTDHSIVCHIIGKMWELPLQVYQAMSFHSMNDLGFYPDDTARHLSLILRLTETFINNMAIDSVSYTFLTTDTIPLDDLVPSLQEELGLDSDMIEEIYGDLESFLISPE